MKTLAEIETALSQEYKKEGFHAVIKELGGLDYIPWDESNRIANRIFGYLGWSSSIQSCEHTSCTITRTLDNGEVENREFTGFVAILRVTVTFYDEMTSTVQSVHHDGVGYGNDTYMGNKNPMDTACKAAGSDALSVAFKKYGDAFGLFLYAKAIPENGTSSASTYRSPSTGTGKGPSEKQQAVLTKNLGITAAHIAALPYEVWKPAIDACFNGGITQEIRDRVAEYKPEPSAGAKGPFPFTKAG